MFGWSPGALPNTELRKAGLWACSLPVLTLCTSLIPLSHPPMDLSSAQLPLADLECAGLKGANLRGTDLHQALLMGAHLGGADLAEANLEDADLFGADLRGAKLRGANLRGVMFSSANLYRADLRGARLEGAYLELVSLAGTDLTGATYDRNTSWPSGVDPIACGAVYSEDPWTGSRRSLGSSFRLGRKARATEHLTHLSAPDSNGG